jgi:Acetyltransferase (GNAT) domain
MAYNWRVFDSIDRVDLTAWQRVCADSGASIFMDPRFVAGVENSMRQSCRFWYVIIYDDDDGRPVACAGLVAMTIDLAELADPRLAWVIRQIPALRRFQQLKVLFCSLPGSPGEKSLALPQTNESAHVLSVLDGVAHELAKDAGTNAIVYKEFGEVDLQWMNRLLELGYRRIPVPPMHVFRHSFVDFSQYCASLKTRYRQQINRSVRKMRKTGIDQLVLTDPDEILTAYTPEVHDLYCQMVAKSDVKLELLPIEYFHQLTSRLGSEADLIALSKESRIVAFGWGLHDGSTYHLTYAGLDYRLNHECDLYFNLMYAGFDRAFRKRVATINAGQTATAFKGRMGCDSAPLYAFVKGLGPMMSRFFYYGANLLVVRKSSNAPSNVFKSGFDRGRNRRDEMVVERRDLHPFSQR